MPPLVAGRWKELRALVAAEIQRVLVLRKYYDKTGAHDAVAFYTSYLTALRKTRALLTLHAPHYPAVSAYAKEKGLTLSNPPAWTDFVPAKVRAAFIEEQSKLPNFGRSRKQVFDTEQSGVAYSANQNTRRLKRAKLEADLAQAIAHNNAMLAEYPDSELAQCRAKQLDLAEYRLLRLPMKSTLVMWEQLLTAEERVLPHDDSPRQLIVPHAYRFDAQEPGTTTPKPRGRPFGAKDAQPRVRRKLTCAEKEARAARRAQHS